MLNSSDHTQIELRHYDHNIVSHTHNHHQLTLPVKGVLEMEIDGVAGDVAASTVAVIPSGQLHSCASSGDNSFLVIDIPAQKPLAEYTTNHLWSAVGENPYVEVDSSVLGYCNFIATEVKQAQFNSLDRALIGSLMINALARSFGLNTRVLPPTLTKALNFIEAQFSNPITTTDIARAAGISESRLHVQFKSEFEISPKLYTTRLRLKHAASLLVKTNINIAEIALRVGYGDQSAFTRAFQRHMGSSPSKFRHCG